jgi:hypothetical protein
VPILANSRPYEGLFVSLGAGAVLLFRIAGGGRSAWRSFFVRAVPPMSIVFALTAAGMCTYFKSVTGSPFRSPYQVYERQYGIMPLPNYFWQPLRPEPPYRHPIMRTFYRQAQAARFLHGKTVKGFAGISLLKIKTASLFFLGPALGIALFAADAVFRDRRTGPSS